MLQILSKHAVLETIRLLSCVRLSTSRELSDPIGGQIKWFQSSSSNERAQLRLRFHSFLNSIQPGTQRMGLGPRITDAGSTDHLQRKIGVLKACAYDYWEILDLAIDQISSIAPAYSLTGLPVSASNIGSIGLIHVAMNRNGSTQDYLECLVYELSLTMLFLDEMRFKHYLDPELVFDQRYYFTSPLLVGRCSLDKMIQNIVVGMEIIRFRKVMIENGFITGHEMNRFYPNHSLTKGGTSEGLEWRIQRSIDSILNKQLSYRLLSPRAIHLLHLCKQDVQEEVSIERISLGRGLRLSNPKQPSFLLAHQN